MKMTMGELAMITGGRRIGGEAEFTAISTDSRSARAGDLFVALHGARVDGHHFLPQAIASGAEGVLIDDEAALLRVPEGVPVVIVPHTLAALGDVAAAHRNMFQGTLLAVTGSNGKTIVKDMLHRLVTPKIATSRSNGSYNSRLGVPLALFPMRLEDHLWIAEAGVSERGDMAHLQRILRPDCGILTNVGMAHLAGFKTRENIASEKFGLFSEIPPTGWVLLPNDEPLVATWQERLACRVYLLNSSPELPHFQESLPMGGQIAMRLRFPGESRVRSLRLRTPSLEIARDAQLAISAATLLGVSPEQILTRMNDYSSGGTRMEIWRAPSGITFINDACSSDPISVESALRALDRIAAGQGRRLFVFGGMGELGDRSSEQHEHIGRLAAEYGVHQLILPRRDDLISTAKGFQESGEGDVLWYEGEGALLELITAEVSLQDTLLLKGPRQGTIAATAPRLFEAIAPNRLIVDFSAVLDNIARFRTHVGEEVAILAMVKALAYGSDMTRLAAALEESAVSWLGVSTPDEGARLRSVGSSLPILVMITAPDEVGKVCRYGLTPVISSLSQASAVTRYLAEHAATLDVHIKVDTGMGRMGVLPQELPELYELLSSCGGIAVTGIMTHLGSAEDPDEDAGTRRQIALFEAAVDWLRERTDGPIVAHAAATSGAIRFTDAAFDMIRVGLGLYGLYPDSSLRSELPLTPAVSLVSRVMDIRIHSKGARLGYNGTFVVPVDGFRVAILPIGYHDGIPWQLSNRGEVLIHGKRAPMVGRVSMDSLLVDVTHIPEAKRGSDVLLFGAHGGYALPAEEVAAAAGTIVYELLARLGPRIQRIFRH